ncbi:M56 family metallopeptidase [Streptomyces gamaensis]|uniref:M56 family metallopeptidase n=1 Tax=Streptomyces gamaensis TaxID=1763542 RepID=A0ABW0YTJ4_9ACTN
MLQPVAFALLSGVVAPKALARAKWAAYAPRLAAAAWLVLMVVFSLACALGTTQLLLPDELGHQLGPVLAAVWDHAWWRADADGTRVLLGTGAGLAVLALPGAAFARELFAARARRGRHVRALRLVGRRAPGSAVTVLDHDTPAVYCVPGRPARVVVSSGALRVLSPDQLEAALAHERAHLRGRHHLLVVGADAYRRAFGRLPLARLAGERLPLLVEMAADDRALRGCSREALATALYEVAAGHTPGGAFAAGGPSAVVRIQRILRPAGPRRPALSGLGWLAVAGAVAVPVAFACCGFLG